MQGGPRRIHRRWHRWLALLWAAALVVSCSGGAGGAGEGDRDAEPGDTPATGETAADRSAPPRGPFPLGRRTLELVDTSRSAPAVPAHGLAAADERQVPVILVYPAAAETSDTSDTTAATGSTSTTAPPAVEDAPVADGRFPLVVFAHGVNNLGDYFVFLAEQWARAGYVVALPTFPVSRTPIAYFEDYVNQPADVSFVIDEILARNEDGDDPLAGHVDDQRVGVGGYSLGAVTVLGVALNSCCVDERIDAAIAVAGGPLPYEGGSYDDPPATPLLVVQGGRDTTAPIAAGDATFDLAEPPVHYLQLAEADHINIWGEELLRTATTAFLDAYLKDEAEALDALPATVQASGRGELREK